MPIEEITMRTLDAYRAGLASEGRLSNRTINKHLVILHGIFKRAQRGETEGLPLVSGLDRATLLKNRVYARLWIQRALSVIARYYAQPRPPLSEVRLGTQGELTLFLRRGGIALRFGRTFSEERLRKLDAVWRALGPKKVKRLRALLLDHEARADRVIARLSPR